RKSEFLPGSRLARVARYALLASKFFPVYASRNTVYCRRTASDPSPTLGSLEHERVQVQMTALPTLKGKQLMFKSNRRVFIKTVASTVVASSTLLASKKQGRMPISFSTLGCPKWDWKTILKNASEWGYAAVELRGIEGELDLTKRPEFNGSRLKQSLA